VNRIVLSPESVVEDLASISEPGIFIVDDVAFIQGRHGLEIGEAIARDGLRKKFYLETRGDVLLRNKAKPLAAMPNCASVAVTKLSHPAAPPSPADTKIDIPSATLV